MTPGQVRLWAQRVVPVLAGATVGAAPFTWVLAPSIVEPLNTAVALGLCFLLGLVGALAPAAWLLGGAASVIACYIGLNVVAGSKWAVVPYLIINFRHLYISGLLGLAAGMLGRMITGRRRVKDQPRPSS